MKLNLRSIDLNLLPVFSAIMAAGQLSRAAEQLGMSQPALSAALQRLRVTFDDPLFIRTKQGMEPTPRARELHTQLQPHLAALRQILSPEHRFNPLTSQRRFRIVSADYFEMALLPPLLKHVQAQAPNIMIEVSNADDSTNERLLKAEADLAIDALLPDDPRLKRALLLEEPLVVIARQGHPQLKQQCLKQQFLDAQHVVLPDRNRRLPLDQILNTPGWERRTGAQVTQFSGLLNTCAHSDMIATVPQRLADQYAAPLNLRVFPFPAPIPPVPVYLLWSPLLDKDPAHQWLREQLKQTIHNEIET